MWEPQVSNRNFLLNFHLEVPNQNSLYVRYFNSIPFIACYIGIMTPSFTTIKQGLWNVALEPLSIDLILNEVLKNLEWIKNKIYFLHYDPPYNRVEALSDEHDTVTSAY